MFDIPVPAMKPGASKMLCGNNVYELMSNNNSLVEELGRIWRDVIEDESRRSSTELRNKVKKDFRMLGSRFVSKKLFKNGNIFLHNEKYFISEVQKEVKKAVSPLFNTIMLNIKLDFNPDTIQKFQDVRKRSSVLQDDTICFQRSSIVSYIRRRYNETFLDPEFYAQVKEELILIHELSNKGIAAGDEDSVGQVGAAGDEDSVGQVGAAGDKDSVGQVGAAGDKDSVGQVGAASDEKLAGQLSAAEGEKLAGHGGLSYFPHTSSSNVAHKSDEPDRSKTGSSRDQTSASSSDLSSVDFATTGAGGSKNHSPFESWRANITFPDDKNDGQMYYVYYVIPQPELVASLTKMQGMLEYIDFKMYIFLFIFFVQRSNKDFKDTSIRSYRRRRVGFVAK